ncbi:MAG: class I SAM-dependent DNA methyltransferase [Hydrogenophilales bacterium]|nr:class I SAM-dependent DNA methyltransferase [Hydrogenophilales bacterium]
MTPQAFIAKWHDNPLSERAGAQTYFNDLCDLLGVDKPNDPDSYCFERGAARTGAGHGWADVWKRGCFAWENKAPGKDLATALKQLMTYALALDNPPLLVVSDREIIQIHSHFTGTPSEAHTIRLADIGLPDNLAKLRALFDDPNRFRPARTTYAVTEEAAGRMGAVAKRLAERGHQPQAVAHFLIQCVFCMFAEDARILPEKLFETVLDKSNPDGAKAQARLTLLFDAMKGGGAFGADDIPWFNGGLFKRVAVPALDTADVVELLGAARMNWSAIEPAILGTLFERGLNPDMRSQLGAHYTDPETIMKLVDPVIVEPLEREWAETRARIETLAPSFGYVGGKTSKRANAERQEGQNLFNAYLERLKNYRVLDPACGSGNFLYLALKSLKDLEHKANLEAEALGLHREVGIECSPANVLGIELNPYAAELARVTVWIGEIQWMLAHGYRYRERPILAPLDHIEQRDAVLNLDGSEADWPACDAIVGNPPFLGDKKMRGELGDTYVEALRKRFEGRVPGGADLVTYWFEKARARIEAGQCQRAGLVATNSIRGGASRKVLERIVAGPGIFEAWGDEPWINNGAAVRVSLVAFGRSGSKQLNGEPVNAIHSDLTAVEGANLIAARRLSENLGVCFEGIKKYGAFDVPGATARTWLCAPTNPNGKLNAEVLRPWINATDVVRNNSDTWVIDFTGLSDRESALYEAPYEHVLQHVKPSRASDRNAKTREQWWLFERPRQEMRKAIASLPRYIVTPVVAKHRLFAWRSAPTLAMNLLDVIVRSDDATFGILHSRFHELWSLRLGTSLEDRPRYTPTTTFETFPFPAGLTPRDTAAPTGHAAPPCMAGSIVAENIAAAARRLNELREAWLNPPEWVDWMCTPEEERAGFPARPVAKPGHEADLKKRTLTNLYNQRPAWLDHAHRALDLAVAAAYGWTDYTADMVDTEILKRLLALNLERSATR